MEPYFFLMPSSASITAAGGEVAGTGVTAIRGGWAAKGETIRGGANRGAAGLNARTYNNADVQGTHYCWE